MNSKLQAADLTQRLFSFVKILSRVTNTCLQMEFSRAHGQFCLWSSRAEACRGQSKVGWAPQGLRFHASGKGLAGVLKRPDYVKGFDELMRTEQGDIFGFLLGNRSSSKACKVFMEKMPPIHREKDTGLFPVRSWLYTKSLTCSPFAVLVTSVRSHLGAGQGQKLSSKEGESREISTVELYHQVPATLLPNHIFTTLCRPACKRHGLGNSYCSQRDFSLSAV